MHNCRQYDSTDSSRTLASISDNSKQSVEILQSHFSCWLWVFQQGNIYPKMAKNIMPIEDFLIIIIKFTYNKSTIRTML